MAFHPAQRFQHPTKSPRVKRAKTDPPYGAFTVGHCQLPESHPAQQRRRRATAEEAASAAGGALAAAPPPQLASDGIGTPEPDPINLGKWCFL